MALVYLFNSTLASQICQLSSITKKIKDGPVIY